ncbi:MAG: DNA polymerase III subunit delta [Eubacterium sp.]|nr:DNA polymerase III subunit delta [Eubacterium sp.]
MARISENELKAQLKSGEFSNVYIIYGEENYLKEYYVKKLKNKLVDSAFEDFNFHSYDGKNASMDDIIMDAQMIPMMSEYSFVLVHDFPFDKDKDACDKIKEYIKEPVESAVIVFWMDAIEVDIKKNSKYKSLEAAFSKNACSVNLERRSENDLAKLIVSSAKKRGCKIDMQNARYLISIVGSDIQTIFNELEKLCANIGEGEIDKKLIDSLATKSLQARVFDLSRFILRGDSNGAYNVLRVLFAQKEEPIGILSVISNCYIDMYRVKCAKRAGANEGDIANYFNYKGRDFLIRNAARDVSSVSKHALRSAIDVLCETDEAMKSTAIDKNILLEETVAKLLMLRNA